MVVEGGRRGRGPWEKMTCGEAARRQTVGATVEMEVGWAMVDGGRMAGVW